MMESMGVQRLSLVFPDPWVPASVRDGKNNNQSIQFLYPVMDLVREPVHQNVSYIPITNLTMQRILLYIIKS